MSKGVTAEMMRAAIRLLDKPRPVEPLCMYKSEYDYIRTEWSNEQIDTYARANGFDGFLVYNANPQPYRPAPQTA